jgi:IS30 family transposase
VHYPKGTDFATLKSSDVEELEHRLNNRPMKVLKGKTPSEAMSEELSVLGH